MSNAPEQQLEASRAEKLRRIEALGFDPWGGRFDGHQPIAEVLNLPADVPDDQRPRVRIAGRIVSRRDGGKVHFLDLKDWSGKPTLREIKGEREGDVEKVPDLSSRDSGHDRPEAGRRDRLAAGPAPRPGRSDRRRGHLRQDAQRGEPTIFADKLTFLGKSLLPHPDKFAGMQDMEFRLRHRYLDLIYNPETLDRASKRILIVRTIRRYLDERGFFEVETPTLHAIAGGAAARPFITHHNALDIDLFLRIALELHLKRLLVGGIEKVYEIGRVFRNEGISPKHNPEFTMMELYQAYGDYRTMMDLTEGLIVACVRCARRRHASCPTANTDIDFTPPWQRLRYADLFREHVGVAMDDGRRPRRVPSATLRFARKTSNGPRRQGSRRARASAVRAARRGQADRAGVRLRLSRGAVPADQAASAATRPSPSGSSCTSTAWNWPTPTPN